MILHTNGRVESFNFLTKKLIKQTVREIGNYLLYYELQNPLKHAIMADLPRYEDVVSSEDTIITIPPPYVDPNDEGDDRDRIVSELSVCKVGTDESEYYSESELSNILDLDELTSEGDPTACCGPEWCDKCEHNCCGPECEFRGGLCFFAFIVLAVFMMIFSVPIAFNAGY